MIFFDFEKNISIQAKIFICILLLITTFFIYSQTIHNGFLSFDDNLYVTENPIVKKGLSYDNIVRAFNFTKKGDLTYWHPLSLLSHMIDIQLFGLNPAGHHFSNIIIHTLNTVLLFLLFSSMTRKLWQSAFLATLFALHPINVDTVAWIAERKNLLSTFFWLLTMFAYFYYSKKPGLLRYIPVFLFMLTGLFCKPMLVTLPCILLLMDFWPLERLKRFPNIRFKDNLHLIYEKLPLFGLSIFWSQISSLSMQYLELEIPLDQNPMKIRIANAILSYVKYIQNMFWPYDLSIYYPYPQSMPPLWQIILAFSLLSILSILILKMMKTKPWLTFGWLWYVGTLVPVLGLVQNGLWPEIADRWAYVPMIGLFIIISWSIPELLNKWHIKKQAITIIAIFFIIAMTITTWYQIKYWSSSLKLFSHAIQVTRNNPVSQYNLANEFQKLKNYSKAIEHYNKALQLKPDAAYIHNNLGAVFIEEGKLEKAFYHISKALEIDSEFMGAHINMGNLLNKSGQPQEAIQHYIKVLNDNPNAEKVHYNLGLAFEKIGQHNEATKQYQLELKNNPNDAETTNSLGNIFLKLGNTQEAIRYFSITLSLDPNFYRALISLGGIYTQAGKQNDAIKYYYQAIAINPELSEVHYNLGVILRGQNNIQKAVNHFYEAVRINPNFLEAHIHLGNAFANLNQIDQAIKHIKEVLRIKPDYAEMHYYIAMLFIKQNNIDPAIQHFYQATLINPNFEAARVGLEKSLIMKKNSLNKRE